MRRTQARGGSNSADAPPLFPAVGGILVLGVEAVVAAVLSGADVDVGAGELMELLAEVCFSSEPAMFCHWLMRNDG